MLTIDSWPAKTHRVTQEFANALAPTVAPPQTGRADTHKKRFVKLLQYFLTICYNRLHKEQTKSA